jgi:hypothetical protein
MIVKLRADDVEKDVIVAFGSGFAGCAKSRIRT